MHELIGQKLHAQQIIVVWLRLLVEVFVNRFMLHEPLICTIPWLQPLGIFTNEIEALTCENLVLELLFQH